MAGTPRFECALFKVGLGFEIMRVRQCHERTFNARPDRRCVFVFLFVRGMCSEECVQICVQTHGGEECF